VRSRRLVVSALVLVDPLSTLCVVSYHNHFCFPYHLILDNNLNLAAATLATVDVIAQNKDRKTPLDLASEQGLVDIAHMPIEHGTDLTAQMYGRDTPLL
jgi:ankyrin repeat protein